MKCVFLGPPGAGKGTLALEVSKLYDIVHISTGDLFRSAIKNGTELGKKIKAVIESGALVSDDLTVELLKERLKKDDWQKGFILDGFPRTVAQADALSNIVALDYVINLDISDEEVIERLSGRRVCSKCGHSFHIKFMKPKTEGLCDECEGSLITREDDKREAIEKRLKTYAEQTYPLIQYYKEKGLLVSIDARPSTAEILKDFQARFAKK
ncbi:MAG: adenylate kinase [Treponema sp.]